MSLLELITAVRDLTAAIKSKDWPSVFTALSKILSAAAALFGPQPLQAASGDDAELEAAANELRACSASRAESAADPKAIDPATILVIVQLAGLVIEWIKKRRQGN